MTRNIRHAALLGAVLLGAGCEKSATPDESTVVPRPVFLAANQVELTTRVSGLAFDPEAFWVNVANCGRTCPIPPFLSEAMPHYLRSAVRNAGVLTFDVAQQQPGPIGAPAISDAQGLWVHPSIPARYNPPYFMLATGSGAMPDPSEPLGPPAPAVPATTYLPTLNERPIVTGQNGTCVSQEVAHIGKNGILEAVAKHLTATGTNTTVDDLVNPSRYWTTKVFWFYAAGNPALRVPANGIALEVNVTGGPHQTFVIDWAPAGVLPPFLNQSTRGFYVTNAPVSPMGIYVVLVPVLQGPPPSSLLFLAKDTVTNAATFRPWTFPPIPSSIGPGAVSFIGAQMQFPPNPLRPGAGVPPPHLCLPPGI
ncbi:MAG TPA: hypothetical protein VF815_06920 [Myxococcaceae bacterium]|jgi:hypothetical protein